MYQVQIPTNKYHKHLMYGHGIDLITFVLDACVIHEWTVDDKNGESVVVFIMRVDEFLIHLSREIVGCGG